jgi:macrolide transport system ATP-binding/permease protein
MSWSRPFRRRKADAELQEELDSFLAEEIAENLARGKSPEEARRLAKIKLGSRQTVRETAWRQNTFSAIDSLWPDLKYAVRALKRAPAFTAVAILVLALGIGASVAIFALVDAALIKPLPYKDPARLVSIYEVVPSCSLCRISYQNFLDWRKSNLPFSSLEAWNWTSYLIDTPQGTEPGRGVRVSDKFFRTLGVTPILGRDFYAGEDAPGAPHTVLLSALLRTRQASAINA